MVQDDEERAVLTLCIRSTKQQGLRANPTAVSCMPGLGLHKFSWKGHELHCLRQTLGEPVGTSMAARQKENLLLFVRGRGQQRILQQLCNDLIEQSEQSEQNTFTMFHWDPARKYWG